MLLEFTKDLGRYKTGSQHDYPKSVWDKLAQDAGMALSAFTKPAAANPVLQSPLKGRARIHKRLGASQ